MTTEIKVPTLGESLTEATVATWLKQVGDTVVADEPILELETDKVTMEVNAPVAGTITEIVAPGGTDVEVGALLGTIGDGGAAEAPAPKTIEEEPLVETGAAGGGDFAEIKVPPLGESISEATVATWLKAVGDAVVADEPLVELETDKVTIEVNAPIAGTLSQIMADEGADVKIGVLLGVLGGGGAAAQAAAPKVGGYKQKI